MLGLVMCLNLFGSSALSDSLTPWTATCQACWHFTIFWGLLRLTHWCDSRYDTKHMVQKILINLLYQSKKLVFYRKILLRGMKDAELLENVWISIDPQKNSCLDYVKEHLKLNNKRSTTTKSGKTPIRHFTKEDMLTARRALAYEKVLSITRHCGNENSNHDKM